jgi:hypothetical protein
MGTTQSRDAQSQLPKLFFLIQNPAWIFVCYSNWPCIQSDTVLGRGTPVPLKGWGHESSNYLVQRGVSLCRSNMRIHAAVLLRNSLQFFTGSEGAMCHTAIHWNQ